MSRDGAASLAVYRLMAERLPWAELAACRGMSPATFVSEGRGSEAVGALAAARRVCARCSVADECLGYALGRPGLLGVWGGTTARQRQVMRRGMAQVVPFVEVSPA